MMRKFSLVLLVAIAVALLNTSLFLAFEMWSDNSPPDVTFRFNVDGKNFDAWILKQTGESKWTVGHATLDSNNSSELKVTPISGGDRESPQLINTNRGGVDIFTAEEFGDCTIELEFMIPKGANSGVYVMGEYEVQIFDSYGNDHLTPSDLGGLYKIAAPKVNAANAHGEWQKLKIHFQAPRFDGTVKLTNAKFIKVTLNDQLIHENVEMPSGTPGGISGVESTKGSLMLQGHHDPVSFRNINITTTYTK